MAPHGSGDARARFEAAVRAAIPEVVVLCAELVRVPSGNPPGDTGPIADLIEARLMSGVDIACRRVVAKPPAVNLIAKLKAGRPGRHLVMNGHLDTFPVGDTAGWTQDPLGGVLVGNRLYGRGASDMKAGLAVAATTLLLLARHRDALAGELTLALVGDEETGGLWGTQYLLANEPDTVGDAMLSADAGSPGVLRFGEKGQLWIEVEASGKSHHGAHVHLGRNAIEALLPALDRLLQLRDLDCPMPPEILAAIDAAASRSEAVSGRGETTTLKQVTVNLGVIQGGISVNLIPDRARARADIRFPPGLTVKEVVAEIERLIGGLPDVRFSVLAGTEPNWTDPDHEIIRRAAENAEAFLGTAPARNMRLGFSNSASIATRASPPWSTGRCPMAWAGPTSTSPSRISRPSSTSTP